MKTVYIFLIEASLIWPYYNIYILILYIINSFKMASISDDEESHLVHYYRIEWLITLFVIDATSYKPATCWLLLLFIPK